MRLLIDPHATEVLTALRVAIETSSDEAAAALAVAEVLKRHADGCENLYLGISTRAYWLSTS